MSHYQPKQEGQRPLVTVLCCAKRTSFVFSTELMQQLKWTVGIRVVPVKEDGGRISFRIMGDKDMYSVKLAPATGGKPFSEFTGRQVKACANLSHVTLPPHPEFTRSIQLLPEEIEIYSSRRGAPAESVVLGRDGSKIYA